MSNHIKVGAKIFFKYKGGRKIIGTVNDVIGRKVHIILHTDYIGKNEEWYKGDVKLFNISEMKEVKPTT